MDFTNKAVLVTGAGAGIGKAAVELFARAGAKVAVNTLNPGRGAETLALAHKAGSKDSILALGDVSDPDAAKKVFDSAVAAFGRLDILVNNAGIVLPGRVDNTSLEDYERTMTVNVRSVFLLSGMAIRQMLKQGGGTIINTASSAGLKGVKDRAAYSASKGALVALTRAMAADHMKDNIRINCVCPGTTLTPSMEDRINATPDPEQTRKDFTARQPMGRLGTAEEIANAILFAAWDGNSFMNGAIVSVDGGMTV